MQRWEYLTVFCAGNKRWFDSAGASGEFRGGWIDPDGAARLLDAYGDDGWEVVNALAGQSIYEVALLLKRPKA